MGSLLLLRMDSCAVRLWIAGWSVNVLHAEYCWQHAEQICIIGSYGDQCTETRKPFVDEGANDGVRGHIDEWPWLGPTKKTFDACQQISIIVQWRQRANEINIRCVRGRIDALPSRKVLLGDLVYLVVWTHSCLAISNLSWSNPMLVFGHREKSRGARRRRCGGRRLERTYGRYFLYRNWQNFCKLCIDHLCLRALARIKPDRRIRRLPQDVTENQRWRCLCSVHVRWRIYITIEIICSVLVGQRTSRFYA